jgi:V-type H+-transporting ATPase subunit A
LKTRPSLFDLVQKKNIDEISTAPIAAPNDVEPAAIPLPQSRASSPLISPQRELRSVSPPPHITLHEATDEEKSPIDRMPPVRDPGVEVDVAQAANRRAQKAQKKPEKEEAEEHGKLEHPRYAEDRC